MPRFFRLPIILTFALCAISLPLAAQEAVKPAAPASATPSEVKAPAGENHSGGGLWSIIRTAGTTGMIQIGLSIFGAAIALERFAHLQRKYVVPAGVSATARELWKKGDYAALEKLAQDRPSTLTRALAFAARHHDSSLQEVSAITGDLVSQELEFHSQRSYWLGVIATLEPLFGLLGMILGMIETFRKVVMSGALGDPTLLASGISEALVTTALGLLTAIVFLTLHHFFKHRIGRYGVMLEKELTDLLADWFVKGGRA